MVVDDRHHRVVFLGPPNSGKGTQAAFLAEHLGIPAISTGEMLRAAVSRGSALGKRVEAVLAAGELVADDLMAEVISARLSEQDAKRGFLLDGYPRTDAQADTLDQILRSKQQTLDVVVLIDAPEDVLVERALGRGRVDDREEIVRERLRLYREKTAPLIERYRDRGLLQEVDGDRSIETVRDDLFSRFGEVAR